MADKEYLGSIMTQNKERFLMVKVGGKNCLFRYLNFNLYKEELEHLCRYKNDTLCDNCTVGKTRAEVANNRSENIENILLKGNFLNDNQKLYFITKYSLDLAAATLEADLKETK